MSVILILKLVALAALFILGVALYGASEIIRIPFWIIPTTPEDYGLSAERVTFKTFGDLTLTGWWIPATRPSPVTIIVQHGIGSNAGDLLASSLCLRRGGDWNLFYYNFRGHADSEGVHTSLGPLELLDMQHAVRFLRARWPEATQRLGLYGHSLGGAVGIVGAAGLPEIEAVIAENPFSRIRTTIRRFAWIFYHIPYYPFIPLAMRLSALWVGVGVDRFAPVDFIGKLTPRPVLLIHGERDRRIPLEDVQALYDAAGAGKQLWTVPGAGHGDAWLVDRAAYEKRMVDFFSNLFEGALA